MADTGTLFPDSIYNPATFGPSQGGLIDQLLASGALSPIPPSAGFPGAPGQAPASAAAPPVVAADDDEAPAAPAQASPLAIGNYQMPRIGPTAAFTPQPAPMPQQPAAAPAAAPSPLDIIRSHLDAGAQSFGHGGGLIGGTAALITGQRHDPQNEAHQQQLAQTQQLATALAGVGIAPQRALQLATIRAIDPEAGRQLIEKEMGPPQAAPQYAWDPTTKKAVKTYDTDAKDNFVTVQTGEDAQGQKTFQKMNRATGEMTPIASAPGADNGGGIGDTTKTGEEYLATLDPKIRGQVKALAEYRQAPPTGFAAAKPYWAKTIMPAVQQYDPTYDATQYGARAAGAKDFTSGKSSEMVRSANQTLQHVNALLDSADALHNGNYPTLNYVGNKANEMTGGGEPGAFITNAHAVADEMGKVFKGSNLSDSEIKAWADNLSPNMSPAQQRAQIGKMTELLHGALDALDEKRVASIGQTAADKAGPIIKPEGQKVLQRIDGWLKSNSDASNAPTVDRSAIEAEMKRRGLVK
jgi:hypothetical protein